MIHVTWPDEPPPGCISIDGRVFEPRDQHEREVRDLEAECGRLRDLMRYNREQAERFRQERNDAYALLADGVSRAAHEAALAERAARIDALGDEIDELNQSISNLIGGQWSLKRERDEARHELASATKALRFQGEKLARLVDFIERMCGITVSHDGSGLPGATS